MGQRAAANSEAVKSIIRRLGSRRSQVREQALDDVAVLGRADAADLASWLCARVRRRRGLCRCAAVGAVSGYASNFFFLPAWLFTFVLMLFAGRLRIYVTALTRLQIAEAVGPLAEAYEMKDVRREVRDALVRVLPGLHSSDAGLLTGPHFRVLCSLLRLGIDADGVCRAEFDETLLQIEILKAVEKIGGEQAQPFVERLAGSTPQWSHNARVQQEAQRCLAVLNARTARENDGRTLLRPTRESAASGDALLRPAANADESAPEQLLRADGNEEHAARTHNTTMPDDMEKQTAAVARRGA